MFKISILFLQQSPLQRSFYLHTGFLCFCFPEERTDCDEFPFRHYFSDGYLSHNHRTVCELQNSQCFSKELLYFITTNFTTISKNLFFACAF